MIAGVIRTRPALRQVQNFSPGWPTEHQSGNARPLTETNIFH